MNKSLKATMVFLCATLLAVLGILGSYIFSYKANAETSDGVKVAEATEPTTIVTVPVLPMPTEPTKPFPTQGETGDIKWIVNDEKQLIISKNNTGDTCSTGDWYETYTVYYTIHTLDPNQSFQVPEERERIFDTPWSKCDYNSVIIKEGVTEIGAYTFYKDDFEKIALPDSLKKIGYSAFCATKTTAKIDLPVGLESIGKEAFRSSTMDFGNIKFSASLTGFGEYAFGGCKNILSADMSDMTMKTIPYKAFAKCSSLKNINFPNGLESIGQSAFEDCSSLESVTFPSELKSILSNAFQNCTNIDKIVLPENMEILYNCSFLNSASEFTFLSKDMYILNNSVGSIEYNVPIETVIKGYTGSTAAEYAAQSDKFTFEPLDNGKGDLNSDGLINMDDAQLLQDYLVNIKSSDDIISERADISEDGSINVFDLVGLKRMILQN